MTNVNFKGHGQKKLLNDDFSLPVILYRKHVWFCFWKLHFKIACEFSREKGDLWDFFVLVFLQLSNQKLELGKCRRTNYCNWLLGEDWVFFSMVSKKRNMLLLLAILIKKTLNCRKRKLKNKRLIILLSPSGVSLCGGKDLGIKNAG